ncbi:hypothetical protein DM02DRAFT_598529 [Periconia macrospinosa]|uniref:DUF7726 domain-containing protein n=1 Tax=Periconia macrospinosa TaxID=97972 RepID=A0A2V1DFB9_9PLEO|nr:hypothetical protein DM02DRAFT_598529 [Periconia macrospinosa]
MPSVSAALNLSRPALGNISPNVGLSPPSLNAAGIKRAIDLISDDDEDDEDDDLDGMYIDKNCDQIRRLIRNLIDSGEMKVGEFQRTIGVSSPAYCRFMAQNGPEKGAGCDAYTQSWKYFKRRELKGIKMPTKKRAKTAASSATAAAKGSAVAKPGSETANGKDLSDIHLDGEENDEVPVYDTCDEVRRKINAHLRKDGVIVAAFLRDLQAQYHTAKAPAKIQSTQLSTFRNKKGPTSGNTSSVFYASYCFFEKLRIAEGKKKSDNRLDMEKIYGHKGLDIKTLSTGRVWVTAGASVIEDKFGRVSTVR